MYSNQRVRGAQEQGCWHPRSFNKAVVIIIDALRYDFTVPFQPTKDDRNPHHYHNALQALYSIAKSQPDHAFLLPFIADPPTTTLQRLKGLTTGTLPTFIDAGSNFAGTTIEEDNLLEQLNTAGKRIVHLGDDTWHSLFPGYFDSNLTHAYDSFNVWDLHTVDNGVLEHIFPLLEHENTARWDVVFGHFLGVDHAGHRYGPDHPAMTEKLQQMEIFVHNITNAIDDDTLLVIMGDHGMDTKGDHGGESDEEVEAALWMYSKKPKFGRLNAGARDPPATAKERPVRQIDLVPTLALLLGLPIPFNNLGKPIAEAFAMPGEPDWQNLASINRLSAMQIVRYQLEYELVRNIQRPEDQTTAYVAMMKYIRGDMLESSAVDWKTFYENLDNFQRLTLDMYRALWANFNITSMLHGIEVLSGGLLLLMTFSRGMSGDKTVYLPLLLRNIGFGIAFGVTFGTFAGASLPQIGSTIDGALYGIAIGGVISTAFSFYELRITARSVLPQSVWAWLALLFTISQAGGFAANSFTIHEDSILLYFLTTFGVCACTSSLRQTDASDRILGTYHSVLFSVLTRAASFSKLCREEQMPYCRSTFYASSTSSTSAPWQVLIPFGVAIILPEVIKAFYKGTASYEGSAGFLNGFCFRVGLTLIAVYWTIDAADNAKWLVDSISSEALKIIGLTIARCVIAVALAAGVATFIWAKPCVKISLSPPGSESAISPASDRHTVNSPPSSKPSLTVLGYANVHGTRYLLLLPALYLLVCLVLPPMGQFSLAILLWQILALLEILDTNKLSIISSSTPGTGVASNSSIGPIVLAMLGAYHFFKTGHQAALSSIQWNSAFVPLRTITYPWSPLLVMLNTFGAQLLTTAAVPLVALWKRPTLSVDKRTGRRGVSVGVLEDVFQAVLTHLLYYATMMLATTMWAGHLRRHLMLYRVFMPRYLLATGVLVVVEIVVLAIAWVAVWIAEQRVGEVFGW